MNRIFSVAYDTRSLFERCTLRLLASIMGAVSHRLIWLSRPTTWTPLGGMAAPVALDTTIGVVTPENIAFEYQLAGPFRRLPAYAIDLAVRWLIIILLVILLYLFGALIDFSLLGPFAVAAGLIVYFLISWFYGTVMETYFNGRTVGKWACGIRVIDVEGRPITGRRALLRNLLRIADLAPMYAISNLAEGVPPIYMIPTGMIGLMTMIFTRRMQRLGDLAAGTMVIIDERIWKLPVGKVEDPRVPALASFVPADYRVTRSMARTLAVYAERRQFLTPARRREIARHLTVPLVDLFEFRSDIDPDLLMYSLYYKTFLAERSDVLPDLGPLAGYSPLRRDANKPTSLARPIAPALDPPPVVPDVDSSQVVNPVVTPQSDHERPPIESETPDILTDSPVEPGRGTP
jgi:uncharacterized RDD family membrane protein YckC